jgi:threonine dehydrogenase-like Zn-dependent dehydrogenase
MGNAVRVRGEIAGQSVVVTGCGPIGLMAVARRLAGARHVLPPTLPERLEIAVGWARTRSSTRAMTWPLG